MINGNGQVARLYGVSAEFATPEQLYDAAKKAKDAGYNDLKAYSPFEVHGMAELLGHDSKALGWLVYGGLLAGVVGAFVLQYWTAVIHYPINVGGRPLFTWPAFTPIMFEGAILFAALAAVGYMFIMTGLPQPYDPFFNVKNAEAASRNRFFLCVRTTDGNFHLTETRQFLQSLEPIKVSEVRC